MKSKFKTIHNEILQVGVIKVGTIQEMTGDGYEILVDYETRSFVLARFYNGRLLGINTTAQASQINGEGRADAGSGSGSGSYFEETIIIRTLLAS